MIVQSLLTGGVGGVLLLLILLRLNPDVGPSGLRICLPGAIWWLWGMILIGGVILALVLVGAVLFRGVRHWRWFFPYSAAVVFFLGALLNRLNADVHLVFLSGSGHRTLGQDAIIWFVVSLAIAGTAQVTRRQGRGIAARVLLVLLLSLLPIVRAVQAPPTPSHIRPHIARPLGKPTHSLVVIGVEGLDLNFLLSQANADRFANLQRLITRGSACTLEPYHPFLKRSLWTTVATGAYPRDHRVESRWAWTAPHVLRGAVRLLPWTPFGARWILPPLVTHRVPPPPSVIPPLWARLGAAEVPTTVIGWPGIWSDRWGVAGSQPLPPGRVGPDFHGSLADALAPFGHHSRAVWTAVRADAAAITAAEATGPASNLWIHLRALGTARRLLAPLSPSDTREEALQEVLLELLDADVGRILHLAGNNAVVAIVSPYGLARPNSWERLLRLLGAGHRWHTSPQSCPNGVLILMGPGVIPGGHLQPARLSDVAPTLCYLLGLPVAQYMQGRVILGAIDPGYLEATPLRVVD